MLLSDLFPDPAVIQNFASGIERRVLRIDTVKGRKAGRVDAYYGNAVIEFEKSLKATGAHAEEQLQEYVSGIWNEEGKQPRFLIAIASDGIVWREYQPIARSQRNRHFHADEIELRQLRELTLSHKTFTEFWIWLTSILYRQERTVATAKQFTWDFGSDSQAFHDGLDALKAAWGVAKKASEPQLAYETWQKYLTVTYGRLTAFTETKNGKYVDAELETLFLKHTYLASIAKLLVWASMTKAQSNGALRDVAEDILYGQFFQSHNVANLTEDDFFQWVKRGDVKPLLAPLWERLVSHLATYDLTNIGEDVLKGIYQELIHPKDRHDLGEYYTPDWLCEKIVSEVLPTDRFASVLDPTCGSGSFLRAAITHLKTQGANSDRLLLQRLLESVVGIDIHPLAVTIARATYVLALGPLIRTAQRPIQIPVYLADSLFMPTEVTQLTIHDQRVGIKLKFGGQTAVIPECLVKASDLFDDCIAGCSKIAMEHATSKRETIGSMQAYLKRAVPRFANLKKDEYAAAIEGLWQFTDALASLIHQKKNSIWAFIIRNNYRPAMLRDHFEYVVGNPPWLSYRYIEDLEYQDEVRHRAVTEYRIAPEAQRLFTQMELATVFFMHALKTYGRPGARLGFVMPRGVLSADQHVNLRARSYTAPIRLTQYWDLLGIQPLFQVPACVLFAIRDDEKGSIRDDLPVLEGFGSLPGNDVPWEIAADHLQFVKRKGAVIYLGDRTALSTTPGRDRPNRQSPYARQFRQGATILPQSFYFVRGRDALGDIDPTALYWMETDPDQAQGAKRPYQDVRMRGHVEGRFLYTTALSRHILPFIVLPPALITVPVEAQHGDLNVRTADQLRKDGYREMAAWMRKVEQIRRDKRKDKAERQTVYERLDYQRGITAQNLNGRHLVLYNAAGTNVSAAYLDRDSLALPFLVEHKLYWFSCDSQDEAFYLTAVLNAEVVNRAIKPFQSMGLLGERDIEKKVLDLPIPKYDGKNSAHRDLGKMGADAHRKAAALDMAHHPCKGLARQRGFVRGSLEESLQEIDKAVTTLLELNWAPLY